jgi:hypothetical protein
MEEARRECRDGEAFQARFFGEIDERGDCAIDGIR